MPSLRLLLAGKLDLIRGFAADNVLIYENLGGGQFSPAVDTGVGQVMDLASSDVDQDGFVDLLFIQRSVPEPSWYRNLLGDLSFYVQDLNVNIMSSANTELYLTEAQDIGQFLKSRLIFLLLLLAFYLPFHTINHVRKFLNFRKLPPLCGRKYHHLITTFLPFLLYR